MSRFRYRIGMRKVAGVQLLVILLIVLIVWQIGGGGVQSGAHISWGFELFITKFGRLLFDG